MKVLKMKVLRGPNYWSVKTHRLLEMLLDLEELEFCPTNTIPGFGERLKKLIPSLYEHQCSEGVPGGFFQRVDDGTWMGHVIEHIALEIQTLAGMDVGFGRTRSAGPEGQYYVVISYVEEEAGKYAALAAVRIAEALIRGEVYHLENDLAELRRLYHSEMLGPSTGSIVQEALRRNIPVIRMDELGLVQLGYGARLQRINATLTGRTPSIAVDIAGNKDDTKKLLTEAFVPVPFGKIITSVDSLRTVIEEVGFPLVIKPLDGNQGKGATTNIQNWDDAVKALQYAKNYSEKIIVEKFISGQDFRALVINHKFVAAARRTPAAVTGDGVHTIGQLIEQVNADPARGHHHECVLTTIKVDATTNDLLQKAGCTLDTVLPAGKELWLKTTANLSTGGTATDVTDEVHPANVRLFERISRVIGLDICGIDIMAKDLRTPVTESGGAVIEVNAAPGFRMHLEPTEGKPRNVARPVVDMLFPEGNGRIPLVAVTGTNGKTTTTRLIAHIARHFGYMTGFTTTDGIYLDGEQVVSGDCSGPASAQFVLKDPAIEFAVLESARGGLLRSGLGFDQCDCAVVTNVAADHLGLDGIHTMDQLTKVKAVVPETVKPDGYAILNADDDLVYGMQQRLSCQIALFSLYHENIRIQRHCEAGGLAAYAEDGYLIIRKGNQLVPVAEIREVPITFEGRAEFNISNVLAAILAAYTSNISVGFIRQALKTFVPSAKTTPGRLNIFQFGDTKVILDYAHNPHGVRALGKFVNTFHASRKVGIVTGVGDRRSEDIIAMGEEAARFLDEVIIRLDEDLRGRQAEDIRQLLQEGVRRVDAQKPVSFISNECAAAEYAINHAVPGSVVVILVENVKRVQELIHSCLEKSALQNMRTAV